MVKYISKLLSVLFAVIIVSGFSLTVSAADVTIHDFADYLTEDEITELYSKAEDFSEETGLNIGIILSEDIEGKTPARYSEDIYGEDFGYNTDGVTVLINNDTKEDWIATSGEAILYYSDSRISDIHENSKQDIIDGYYYDALVTYIDSFTDYYYQGIPSDNQNYEINESGEYVHIGNTDNVGQSILIAIATALVVFAICIAIIVRRYKFHVIPNALNYLDKNETAFREKSDIFMRAYTTHVKIQTNSGGSGGSSTHSSGGGTFGGGGSHR